ncbi:MAG: DUF2029 domain-containing protein [Chloroflexi bacterium]|nr:DUF2029 domain-containing protein [Chloroflexota bacterium]
MKKGIRFFVVFSFTGILSLTLIYSLFWTRMIMTPGERGGSDFMGLYAGARIAQEYGFRSMYDMALQIEIQTRAAGYEFSNEHIPYFTHPPFIVPLGMLISDENYVASLIRWSVVILLFNGIAVFLLIKSTARLNFTNQQRWLLAAGTFLFWPTFSGFMNGQDAILLLLGASIWFYFLLEDKPFTAGLGLGLAVIRPQSAILLMAPFLMRHRKLLWGAVISGGILAIVSLALIGQDGLSRYIDILGVVEGDIWRLPHSLDMPTISGILRRNTEALDKNVFRSVMLGGYLVGLTLVTFWLGGSRKFGAKQAGLLTLAALFFVPYAHYHELTLLLIPIYCMIHLLKDKDVIPANYLAIAPLAVSLFLMIGFLGGGALKYPLVYLVMLALAYGLFFHDKLTKKGGPRANSVPVP